MSSPACIINRKIQIKGAIHGDSPLVIAGKVEGTVQTKEPLVIETSGVVHARIQGGDVLVRGEVTGDIDAKGSIELARGSRVIGDLHARDVVMEEGAQFQGEIEIDFEIPPWDRP